MYSKCNQDDSISRIYLPNLLFICTTLAKPRVSFLVFSFLLQFIHPLFLSSYPSLSHLPFTTTRLLIYLLYITGLASQGSQNPHVSPHAGISNLREHVAHRSLSVQTQRSHAETERIRRCETARRVGHRSDHTPAVAARVRRAAHTVRPQRAHYYRGETVCGDPLGGESSNRTAFVRNDETVEYTVRGYVCVLSWNSLCDCVVDELEISVVVMKFS